MLRAKIGLREVRALRPSELVWDTSVIGFGARRQAGDAVAYFLKYRTEDGRQRWMTIGRHGSPWTPDMARDRAREILGEVVSGADPSGEKIAKRKAITVAELCDRYFDDALAGRVRTRSKAAKKASTLTIDRDDLVFPASRGDGRMSGFPKLWARIAKLGPLSADVTPHVLRQFVRISCWRSRL